MPDSGVYAALELRKARSRRKRAPERFSQDVSADASKEPTNHEQAEGTHYEEMQSAPRFPLHLPVSVKAQSGAYSAETQNISANGVLFAMDNDVPVGSAVDFTILLPGDVVGSTHRIAPIRRSRPLGRVMPPAGTGSSPCSME